MAVQRAMELAAQCDAGNSLILFRPVSALGGWTSSRRCALRRRPVAQGSMYKNLLRRSARWKPSSSAQPLLLLAVSFPAACPQELRRRNKGEGKKGRGGLDMLLPPSCSWGRGFVEAKDSDGSDREVQPWHTAGQRHKHRSFPFLEQPDGTHLWHHHLAVGLEPGSQAERGTSRQTEHDEREEEMTACQLGSGRFEHLSESFDTQIPQKPHQYLPRSNRDEGRLARVCVVFQAMYPYDPLRRVAERLVCVRVCAPPTFFPSFLSLFFFFCFFPFAAGIASNPCPASGCCS